MCIVWIRGCHDRTINFDYRLAFALDGMGEQGFD
jgi:hypothetical protein